MRSRAAAFALCLAAAAGCGRGSDRFVSDELGFSIEAPDDWSPSVDRNTVVFSTERQPAARSTIAIRAVKLPHPDEPGLSQKQLVVGATERVLSGLPQTRVTGPTPLSHPSLHGVVFALSYTPPGHNERYDRRHAVLVGRDRKAFHVIHTAPQGQLSSSHDEFVDVVASLRQEASR